MIEQITIKNFQSHKDSTLHLHPGVNAITGVSDSGKTAIIRALRWVTWNRPSGDAFRANWGGDTIVGITTSEGRVERIRTNKDNMYMLNGQKELKAAGTTVPDDVQDILRLDTINLQQQLDRPFLLDDSPGVVAAHFNRIAHLDRIDESTTLVQKWMRDIEQDIKTEERNIETLEEDLTHFAYLNDFETTIEELEQDEQAVRLWQSKVKELNGVLVQLSQIDQSLYEYAVMIEMSAAVETLLALYADRTTEHAQAERLDTLLESIEQTSDRIRKEQEILPAEKSVNILVQLMKDQRKEERQLEQLQQCVDMLEKVSRDITKTQALVKTLEEQFKKEMPNICPLCGAKVKI